MMEGTFKSSDLLGLKNSFGIEYKQIARTSGMPRDHYHDHYEIFYLLSGELLYFIEGGAFEIKAGDIVFIKPQALHHTGTMEKQKYERILVNFTGDFMQDITGLFTEINFMDCFEFSVLRLNSIEKTNVETILFKMLREQESLRESTTVCLKLLSSELLLTLGRLREGNRSLVCREGEQLFISKVLKFIMANYMNSLTLAVIEENFFVSRYNFCRKFKEVLGLTFTQYVNMVRVRAAQDLIRNTNSKISDVGEKAGFENQSHFGRVFKSLTGMSPLQYRKATRQHE